MILEVFSDLNDSVILYDSMTSLGRGRGPRCSPSRCLPPSHRKPLC